MEIWQVPYQLRVMETGGKRSTGTHVSDVIRDLALRGGILDRKYADKIICGCKRNFDIFSFDKHVCESRELAVRIDDMDPEKVELGCAWEERIVKHHPDICFHPGEMVVDKIAMSMDGASFPEETSIFGVGPFGRIEKALHEIKLTWKSSRKPIDEEWMWITQCKAYLKGVSEMYGEPVRVAFIHPYYVNGNYGRDPMDPEAKPRYKIFGARFSDLEIDENWRMIVNHVARMEGRAVKVRVKK